MMLRAVRRKQPKCVGPFTMVERHGSYFIFSKQSAARMYGDCVACRAASALPLLLMVCREETVQVMYGWMGGQICE